MADLQITTEQRKMEKQSYQSSRGEMRDERRECCMCGPSTVKRSIIGMVGSVATLMAGKLYRGQMGLRVRIPLTPGSPPPLKIN